ncbi:transcriptional regulator [Bacteroidia bacterium]|nr:transcriptional regulator [Bacteroidia bacterium]
MELNRLKIVLVERKRTGKWLAEKLGKNEATVSRWCTNESQPSLETLFAIAKVLNVDARELLVSTI